MNGRVEEAWVLQNAAQMIANQPRPDLMEIALREKAMGAAIQLLASPWGREHDEDPLQLAEGIVAFLRG